MEEKFNYTYSAPSEEERKEIQALRREYEPEKEDGLAKLRALNKKVRLPAEICAYALGVVATLMLGVGMCMSMEVIGGGMIAGVVIGIVGIILGIFNYKIYKAFLAARKKKYGGEILKLTDELLKNDGRQ